MNPKTTIYINLHDKVICKIDSENPDLSAFVNAIISNLSIDEKDITCKTEMKDFDISTFQEIIKQSIAEIKESLENELDKYDKIKQTLCSDKNVIEFYNELIENKQSI